MWFPSKQAITYLNSVLELPASGREQDWELELSDFRRLREFIDLYPKLPNKNEFKCALAALIISSFDDIISKNKFDEVVWNDFVNIVKKDVGDLKPVLKYWKGEACDKFAISDLITSVFELKAFTE